MGEPSAVEPATEPRFLTVREAARRLRVSPMSLYREIEAGKFPAVRIRSRLVVPSRALQEIEDAAMTSRTVIKASDWV